MPIPCVPSRAKEVRVDVGKLRFFMRAKKLQVTTHCSTHVPMFFGSLDALVHILADLLWLQFVHSLLSTGD